MELCKTESNPLLHNFSVTVTRPRPFLQIHHQHWSISLNTARSWGNLKNEYNDAIYMQNFYRMKFVLKQQWSWEKDGPFKIQRIYLKRLQQFQWGFNIIISILLGTPRDHLPVSCQDKFGTSNLVQSVEEDLKHKWDCQCHRLQAITEATISLKIHRVSILTLEQS